MLSVALATLVEVVLASGGVVLATGHDRPRMQIRVRATAIAAFLSWPLPNRRARRRNRAPDRVRVRSVAQAASVMAAHVLVCAGQAVLRRVSVAVVLGSGYQYSSSPVSGTAGPGGWSGAGVFLDGLALCQRGTGGCRGLPAGCGAP